MASSVEDALFALGITEWIIRGEPKSEAQFKSMFRKITGVDSSGRAVESAKSSDFGVTWSQIKNKQTELDDAAPMAELRKQRNMRLENSDWTQNRDVKLSNDSAWKTYRQSLRDLPSSAVPAFDSNGFLSNVTWPDEPK